MWPKSILNELLNLAMLLTSEMHYNYLYGYMHHNDIQYLIGAHILLIKGDHILCTSILIMNKG